MTESTYNFLFGTIAAVGAIHLLYNFLAHTESSFWKTMDIIMIIVGLGAFHSPQEYQKVMDEYLKVKVEKTVIQKKQKPESVVNERKD